MPWRRAILNIDNGRPWGSSCFLWTILTLITLKVNLTFMFLDSRKSDTWIPFCCCYNYGTVGHIGMPIFNFIVLPVITAPHNVPTTHISKTHLPIVSLNVRELEFNWSSIDQSRKKGGPPCVGWKPNSPCQALRFIKRISLSL